MNVIRYSIEDVYDCDEEESDEEESDDEAWLYQHYKSQQEER